MNAKNKVARLATIETQLTNGQGFQGRDGKYHWKASDGTVYVEVGAEWIPRGFRYSLERAAKQCLENMLAHEAGRRPRLV